jgi:predicted dehydrogenase
MNSIEPHFLAGDWTALPRSGPPARIALIGVSGYGRIHLQLVYELIERGAVQLVAAAVINPSEEIANVRRLKECGCAVHDDFEEMLRKHAGQIDLCLIPTGIPWHERMTIAALQAGANVLVEKPLAGSLRDVQAICAAEKATGRFVAVGFQDFYTEGTRWLKRELLAGAIGGVKAIRVLGFWPRPASYYTRNRWAGRLRADGAAVFDSPFNNAFGHFVNLALYFAGATPGDVATARHVEAELFHAHEIESFDTGVVRATTAAGTALWLGFSHACRKIADPEIVIEGTAGRAQWSYEKLCRIEPMGHEARIHPLPDAMNTRRVMFAQVLRRLGDPSTAICDTHMATRHTELIEAIHAAAPVHAFPRDLIDWITLPASTSPVPAVQGLEEFMQAAFRKRLQLREIGFPLTAVSVK